MTMAQPTPEAHGPEDKHAGKALPPVRVLVIDDDPDILEYLQDFLRTEGFEVTTLSDPTVAVERIETRCSTWSCST